MRRAELHPRFPREFAAAFVSAVILLNKEKPISQVCVYLDSHFPRLPPPREGGFALPKALGEEFGFREGARRRVRAPDGSSVGLSAAGRGYARTKISFQLKKGDYYFRDDSCSGNNPNLWSQLRVLGVCWVRPPGCRVPA